MAGKTFGAWGIPAHVTPSAPELRRHMKHPVACVSLLNRGCSLKQNLSGQRFMLMLMGCDQNPHDSSVRSLQSLFQLSFLGKVHQRQRVLPAQET